MTTVKADSPAHRAARVAERFVGQPDVFHVELLWAADVARLLSATLHELAARWPVNLATALELGATDEAGKRFQEPVVLSGGVLALSAGPPSEGEPCAHLVAVLAAAEVSAIQRYEMLPRTLRAALDHLVDTPNDLPSTDERRQAAALARVAHAVLRSGASRHPHGIDADVLTLRRPRPANATWFERCRVLVACTQLAAGDFGLPSSNPKFRLVARGADARATVTAIAAARAAIERSARRPIDPG